jgi:heptosyltransferase-2
MRPYVAEVLAGTHWLDDVILYSKQARGGETGLSSTIERLRAAELDSVLLLTNSFRTAWMAWRSGVPQRIGYTGNFRSWLLSERVVPLRRPNGELLLPPIDAYLQLAEAFGCPHESNKMQLATTAADELTADEAWQRLELPRGDRVIVLNSGGAFGAAKHWPPAYFAELARRIVSYGKYWVLVNCGPAERQIAAEIVARADHRRVVGLADCKELPTGLTKACIRRSKMLVSTDSGPRFFGLAFGKPVVTLFGPTDPAATVTYDENETPLSLSLDCQPCKKRACPLVHHRCMQDLTVERVFAAVARQLTRDKERVTQRVA